ncbi:MAG: TetR/AcrR family transcriptional regulator [Actinomycetota bacterium]|nr:TetR/AcrR family transcriptional regulator [Actinomycetota bacterium]
MNISEPITETSVERTISTLPERKSSARTGLTPKGEATRARLIEIAEEVFGEIGYDQASISEITRRSGVAQGTFYLYFNSKKEIFSELVRQIGRNVRHEIQASVEGLTKRSEIERKGFETFFEYVRQHPSIYRIVRQAEFVDRDAFRDYYEGFANGYKAGLKQASAKGEVKAIDPEVLAWCLMGMGDLIGIRWILLRDEGKVPKKVLDTMIDFITGGMIAATSNSHKKR